MVNIKKRGSGPPFWKLKEMNTMQQTQNISTSDHLVESCLSSLRMTHAGKVAIHFHLSQLLPYNRQSFQIVEAAQNAKKSFGPLLNDILILKNSDILCILDCSSPIQIERSIIHYKKAFTVNDPILKPDIKQERFYTMFNLGTELREFEQTVTSIQRESSINGKSPDDSLDSEDNGKPFLLDGIQTETLSLIQNVLKQADVSNFIRRQPIAGIHGEAPPTIVADHFFVSIGALQDTLKITEAISANIWLFKQLTFYLDKQVIQIINDFLNQRATRSIHVNLNMRTIVTNHFQNFLNSPNTNRQMTFEIDVLDLLAHTDAYLYIVDMLKKKGHMVCVSGLNSGLLPFLLPETLSADKFKINWSLSMCDNLEWLHNWVETVGSDHVILHKCDTDKAFEVGLSLGIHYFQGFKIDELFGKPSRNSTGFIP